MSARQGNYPLGPDYWDVNQAATRLTAFACTVSARHLSHGMARMQFNREVAYFSKQVVDKVAMQQLSPEEGMKLLKGNKPNYWCKQQHSASRPLVFLVG